MIELIYRVSEGLLVLTGVLTLWRMLRGPSVFDRTLGLELMSLLLVGFLLLESRRIEIRFYLDAALILALFSFAGTVMLGRVLEEENGDV
ncbi:MAG: pesticidal protein Cry22Aa [Candidatus Eisenbacteria bacterium]|uniref:Pesticidal protein Cry22Aa n=1 Tax=Eiseniibacteriota bacterium TaxID=2212470 RepID=A0A956NJE0_UNCEI|nr:pesticidal protein Cry22Aa [Candidatus Eisenbacteria bacterium]